MGLDRTGVGVARGFERTEDGLACILDAAEIEVISGLLQELSALLQPAQSTADLDPLAVELGLSDLSAATPEPPDNPILERLLPDGYRDDAFAAADFRKYTDDSLRRSKMADAAIVRAGLELADPDGTVRVNEDEIDCWLRAINDLRLALGVQLGIGTEDPEAWQNLAETDPLYGIAMIYDFLTWWQDSLITAALGSE